MENSNGWASFPIIYSDGVSEYNMGNIEIYSALPFKSFQQVMSQRIGLNPNKMLIYLVRMASCPEYQPRIPVTAKVNFQFIVKQRGCYFYVIPKASSSRSTDLGFRANKFDSYYNNDSPSPAFLLRRNQPAVDLSSVNYPGYQLPFGGDRNSQTEASILNDRLQKLAMEKEKLQRAMAAPLIDIRETDPDMGPGFIVKNQEEAFCKQCAEANQDDKEFHLCVNDKVIEWFKTTAGPIGPPKKTTS